MEVVATIATDDGSLHEFYNRAAFDRGLYSYAGTITSIWTANGDIMCSKCGKVWDTFDPCALCNASKHMENYRF
jgi:hypothetical protein